MKGLTYLLITVFFVFRAYGIPKIFEGIDLRRDREVSLDLSGERNIVAIFLSSNCPCSQSHFDYLNDLTKQFKTFSFLGFHSNKEIEKGEALRYFSKLEINFPVLLDKTLKYADIFRALKTPHVFVVNGEGEILFAGGATDSRNPNRASRFYLEDTLREITNGKAVSIKLAKTIGCYINREVL